MWLSLPVELPRRLFTRQSVDQVHRTEVVEKVQGGVLNICRARVGSTSHEEAAAIRPGG
jgi:hypothetical protein